MTGRFRIGQAQIDAWRATSQVWLDATKVWLGTIEGRMAISAAVHLIVLFFVFNAWWLGAHKLRPVGTAKGVRVFRLYDPSQESAKRAPVPHKVLRIARTRIIAPNSVPTLEEATTASPDPARGNGEVNIVYLQGFPPQRPDLASAGAAGDIELYLQIDESGHIAQIHTRGGITNSVDQTVIATVEQWIFQPAMRNGRPIASSQELHFHFKRESADCGWECFTLEVQ